MKKHPPPHPSSSASRRAFGFVGQYRQIEQRIRPASPAGGHHNVASPCQHVNESLYNRDHHYPHRPFPNTVCRNHTAAHLYKPRSCALRLAVETLFLCTGWRIVAFSNESYSAANLAAWHGERCRKDAAMGCTVLHYAA